MNFFKSTKPIFSKKQLQAINCKTPESAIEIKTDKNGFSYKSVKSSYVKLVVSEVTGGNYNFEVLSKEINDSTKEAIVLCRLTIFSENRKFIREQFGQHHLSIKTEVVGKTATSFISDIGNGYKAAASNAFKKCSSEFGFFRDIYEQVRPEVVKSPEISHADQKKTERLSHFLNGAKTVEQTEAIYEQWCNANAETQATKELLFLRIREISK